MCKGRTQCLEFSTRESGRGPDSREGVAGGEYGIWVTGGRGILGAVGVWWGCVCQNQSSRLGPKKGKAEQGGFWNPGARSLSVLLWPCTVP